MPPRARTLAALPLAALLTVHAALAAQSVAAGDSALARGDTTAAIAAYEAAVDKDLHNAEAHYRAGELLMTRHHPGDNLSAPRRKAEEHFRYASRFQPDSGKYLVALADAFRTETDATVRAQVSGLLTRAVEAVRLHGGSHAPDILYRAASAHWEQYETYAHQMMIDVTLDDSMAVADPEFLRRMIAQRGHMVAGAGQQFLDAAEGELRGALAAEPRFVRAAGLLVVLLGEQARWAEALDVGRKVARAARDSAGAWAVLGLAYARANRWREAQVAYDSAFAHMTPAQRRPYDDLTFLLKRADAAHYDSLPADQRAGLNRVYWDAAQPLFLNNRNETRTEFYARLTYVEYRWSDPLRGYAGYESDRGSIYLRYGPPDLIASQRADPGVGNTLDIGRLKMFWLYDDPPLRFVFSMTPGYARADFADDFRQLYREDRELRPQSFTNVPVVRNLDTIDVQAAQFRSDTAGRTDVAVFSMMPLGRMMKDAAHLDVDLQAAAIVKDSAMHDVTRQRQDARIKSGDSVQVEHRMWRLSLPPKSLLLRVEGIVPALDRAARSSAPLDVRSFSGDSLMMSDVILAASITPRDSAPARWTDFFINPSSGRLAPQSPLGMLWEIYNLTPDSTHTVRYRVDLRVSVKSIERHGAFSIILGGIGDATGLSARGDATASLGYDRQARARDDHRQVEWVTMDLRDAPNAQYEVVVQITDKVTGRLVSEVRRLVVTPTPLTR